MTVVDHVLFPETTRARATRRSTPSCIRIDWDRGVVAGLYGLFGLFGVASRPAISRRQRAGHDLTDLACQAQALNSTGQRREVNILATAHINNRRINCMFRPKCCENDNCGAMKDATWIASSTYCSASIPIYVHGMAGHPTAKFQQSVHPHAHSTTTHGWLPPIYICRQ